MITVCIPWSAKANSILEWNLLTADIVEKFGLPGHRYTTEISTECMKFNFHNDNDGLMCKILMSEYI